MGIIRSGNAILGGEAEGDHVELQRPVSDLVNDLLKRDIELIEAAK